MKALSQLRNRYFFVMDVVLLSVAVLLSYTLRLETLNLERFRTGLLLFLSSVVIVIPLVFYFYSIYSRYWIYASIEEMTLLIVAVSIGAAICGAASLLADGLLSGLDFPRSIPFIFWPLALAVTAGPRFAVRIYAQNQIHSPTRRSAKTPFQPVLIVGAGNAGTNIVRELQRNPNLGMYVVGFVDDDPRKYAARIMGVPVLGNRRAIPKLVKDYELQLVIIAMPTAPGRVIREVVTICEQVGVSTKIMPGLYEVLDGTVSVTQLRNVEIEDLLRREPVRTDTAAVQKLLAGKRVLVTGGGGSIGSELCRQILRCQPAELIVLGHGENSVFEICNELQHLKMMLSKTDDRRADSQPLVQPVIADIRFPDRMSAVFQEYRPQVVFHAAAHKHVPLMEFNPTEAVSNNILGTRNVLDAAMSLAVERFVMISTDKAVNPSSLLGASKRVAEVLVHQAAWQVGKPYVAVRFGNVLGSRGSVLQTFKRQIAAGGPVTVTHPEMKRYFMTIPEAVQLVLQAAVLGQGGEIFMLDMGEPVKIIDLAKDLIELSGLEVNRDIEIVFTGMRPGEKLYEELFSPGQTYQQTAHQKIFAIDTGKEVLPSRMAQAVAQLENAVFSNDSRSLLAALHDLVPEFGVESARAAAQAHQSLDVPLAADGTRNVGAPAEIAIARPDAS